MKKVTFTLALIFTILFSIAGPAPEKRVFKDATRDVNLELERVQGQVLFHLLSDKLGDLDQIIVERNGGNGFVSCKIINVKDVIAMDGYFVSADKFPLSAKVDCLYRLKTISKEGITITYPPVELSALTR